MNTGKVPGSAWRGRVLVSCEMNLDVPAPVALGEGELQIEGLSPPEDIPWELRLMVVGMTALPECDGNYRIQITWGGMQSVLAGSGVGPNRFTSDVATEHGGVWTLPRVGYSLEARFPSDISQAPDVLVELMRGDK
eukprot:SAG11_NODE_15910_length_563_cov_0.665948_1_plen_135_part_01